MTDGRKRLSGSQYLKLSEDKKRKEEAVISKTLKIDSFFAKENVCEANILDDAPKNSHNSKEKTDEGKAEMKESIIIELQIVESEPELIPSERDKCMSNFDVVSKDPAEWIINDMTIIYFQKK